MDSNSSSPSWDEAPQNVYARSNVPSIEEECTNTPFEWEDKTTSYEEESDASSIIVKTVKRRPKHASKNSTAIS